MCGYYHSHDSDTFEINRERAIDYLNTRDNVYVFDGFAGVSTQNVSPFTMSDRNSGIPDIGSKFALFVLGLIMRFLWCVIHAMMI
jgi:hypothetical protein